MSIVSLMELSRARSRSELKIIRRFVQENGFRVIPLTEPISHLAATLMEEHALSGGLQVADVLIAATARQTESVLSTANMCHFRANSRPGTEIVSPRTLSKRGQTQ
jgi:predicted nucleic acid-binding protein